jgi:hypothetical protein
MFRRSKAALGADEFGFQKLYEWVHLLMLDH